MATQIAAADGAFTGSIWGLVDSTSLLNAQNNNTALTTSYVESQTFAPGAITIDGIAVKVASRAASPTGTMSVRLAQGGSLVAGTEVTIDVSDIPERNGEQGWVFFKFGAPVLLLAATNYTVSARTSSAAQVNLFRNNTAGNWSRLLRTTTVGTLGAGDNFHVLGEWTAAATMTPRTVTMDSTAATDYGDNAKTAADYSSVGVGGTLAYGTTAATAYVLRLSTVLRVQYGGTLTIGSGGTEIPRDSTAVLEFDCDTADGNFGLEVFGTCTIAGLSRTAGKDVVQCLLNTDEAIGQTVLGVDTDTGWLAGDEIVVASTTRSTVHADSELRVVDSVTASTVTITAGLGVAHLGTAPMQAEVILLTRNVEVRSVSTTHMTYAYLGPASVTAWSWVRFRYFGSTTALKRGLEIAVTAAGSHSLSYGALRDFENYGWHVNAADADNFAVAHTVAYLMGGSSGAAFHIAVATTGVNWSITDCTAIPAVNVSNGAFIFNDIGGTIQRIRAVSSGGSATAPAVLIDDDTPGVSGLLSDWTIHSVRSAGLNIGDCKYLRLTNLQIWRCQGNWGLQLLTPTTSQGVIEIVDATLWGNTDANILMSPPVAQAVTFRRVQASGDTGFATNYGIQAGTVNRNWGQNVRFESCVFSPVTGIFVAHVQSDINFGQPVLSDVILVNTTLGVGVTLTTAFAGRAALRYQNSGGVDRAHYPALGTVSRNTSVFRTASPSEQLTPTAAVPNFRLRSGPWIRRVQSGQTLTPAVYVRKDGSYVGSDPRLVVLANPAVGVLDDTVLGVFSGAADTWVLVSGTTVAATADGAMVFVVEVDGTVGNVYIDDWS